MVSVNTNIAEEITKPDRCISVWLGGSKHLSAMSEKMSKTWPEKDPRASDPRLGNNVQFVPGDSSTGDCPVLWQRMAEKKMTLNHAIYASREYVFPK
ncbi:unnamed protein product [Danaus chrysippus]|uniref:(African queen) hypothetical protein n=1 Tax=Danaus chrysippus TaxID=151541 RepID=A0A8J2WDC6_9NEOP|nr:unnamed protein product [Danaus chrysippus]